MKGSQTKDERCHRHFQLCVVCKGGSHKSQVCIHDQEEENGPCEVG